MSEKVCSKGKNHQSRFISTKEAANGNSPLRLTVSLLMVVKELK